MAQELCGKELELSVKHFLGANPEEGRRFRLSEGDLFQLLWQGIHAQGIPFASDAHTARGFGTSINAEDPYLAQLSYFLGNGARFYLDSGGHPEICTPECLSVSEAILYETSLCDLLEESLSLATHQMHAEGFPGRIELHKNNMDSAGNSWGCHWNILSNRKVPGKDENTLFKELIQVLVPFFATNSIYTGSGTSITHQKTLHWCISQRALFMEEEVGSSTTAKRNLFNLRDEPLAIREKYRRLHLIAPDHNMSEFAAYLGLGIAQMLVRVVEQGDSEFITAADSQTPFFHLSPQSNYRSDYTALAAQEVSKDPHHRFELRNGVSMTALEHQWEYYRLLRRNQRKGVFSDDPEAEYKLSCFEKVLQSLEDQTSYAEQRVDHLIKRKALNEWMAEQQEALAKKHRNFKEIKIYDWQQLRAWQPVLDLLKTHRAYGALKEIKPTTSNEVMAFLEKKLEPGVYIELQRTVKTRDLRMIYYNYAYRAYHDLLALDVSYHSLKRHPHLWPKEEIGLFHQLRMQGKVPPIHELLPFFPPSESLEKNVENELQRRRRMAPSGRAGERGKLITELHQCGTPAYADWHAVVYEDGSRFKKRTWIDPFALESS